MKQLWLGATLSSALFSSVCVANNTLYDPYFMDVGFTVNQAPISLNVAPNEGNELLVFGRSSDGAHQVAVIALTANGLAMIDRFAIGDHYFSFDVINHENGQSELYFLSQNQVVKYNYPVSEESARLTAYIDVESIFKVSQSNYMKQIDFAYDFNADNRTDVMLPYFDKMQVWLSQANATLSKFALDISSPASFEGSDVRISQPLTFVVDANNDGKKDIASFAAGELVLNLHDESGFTEQRISTRDDIFAIDWWDQIGEDGKPLDQSDLKYRKIERIEDINGDNVIDLVVRYTQSSGVLDRKNDYEIYYGKQQNSSVSFASSPSTAIAADGTLTDLKMIDINGDKRKEVLVSSFELGVSQIVSALLSSSIDQDVLFYRQDAQGSFSKSAYTDYETELGFSISSGRATEPFVALADVNGDGIKDLLLSDTDSKQLQVRYGDSEAEFGSRQRQATELPMSGRYMSIDDINQDGRDDVILYYGKLDRAQWLSRIGVLISK